MHRRIWSQILKLLISFVEGDGFLRVKGYKCFNSQGFFNLENDVILKTAFSHFAPADVDHF